MYRIYSEWCQDEDKKCAGRETFIKMLRDQNIGIHSPRKDQCDICLGHDYGTTDDNIYKKYITLKTEGRNKKNQLKASANENCLVVTMDLQSVLLSPKTLASAMYYETKLQVHNFSIYVLATTSGRTGRTSSLSQYSTAVEIHDKV